MDFLRIRSDQRREGKSGEFSYVKDRSLPEDLMVFCQMFYEDGYLTRSELDMLSCEFKKVNKELQIEEGSSELKFNAQYDDKGRLDTCSVLQHIYKDINDLYGWNLTQETIWVIKD